MDKVHDGRVVVLTNMKGGIGKTTDNDLLAVVASQLFNRKVLLIDYDQQGNTTANILRTYGVSEFKRSFAKAVMDRDFESGIAQISENLSVMPTSLSSKELNDWMKDTYRDEYSIHLAFMDPLRELRKKFDLILFDCPPSTDHVVDAVLTAADYVIPLQELKAFAMESTGKFINEVLIPIVNSYADESRVQILGIIPVLWSRRRETQQSHYDELYKKYGKENIFATPIKSSDRLEMYGETGILLNDYVDRRMWSIFSDIYTEIVERMTYYESTGDMTGFKYNPRYADARQNRVLAAGKEIELDGVTTK